MKRTFLGCLVALCVGFVSGCGGGGTETTVVDGDLTEAQIAAEDEDYEAQMASDESETGQDQAGE